MREPSPIREHLGGFLDDEVSDREWQYLVNEGHAERVESGEKTLEWLAERLRNLRQATGQGVDILTSETPDDYVATLIEAQSALLAAVADRDERVVEFRNDVLGDKGIDPDELESWLKRKAEEEGPSTAWLTVALPRGHTARLNREAGGFRVEPALTTSGEGVEQVTRRFLQYIVPTDQWVRQLPVSKGGVLDRLRNLSTKLAERYDWHEASATAFVLTGATPLVRSWRASAIIGNSLRPKVTLTVDLSIPADRILKIYHRMQSQYLQTKPRVLSKKHLTLARMMAEWKRSMPWQERMERWNNQYPDWVYDHQSNFRRDSLKARERVLGMAGPDFESILHDTESDSFPDMIKKIEERRSEIVEKKSGTRD